MLAHQVLVDLVENGDVQALHVVKKMLDKLKVFAREAILLKGGATLEISQYAVFNLRNQLLRPGLHALIYSEFKSLK